MKRIVIVFGLMCVLVGTSVQAHEVKHSGTLDILLHMEPLDNPAARDPAQMYFSVSDSANKFKFSDCDCSVKVTFNDKEILNRKVTPEDDAPDWGANVARINTIFPQVGIYKVSITGTSKVNTFADFHLEYDKRIERESETVPVPITPEEDSGINYYVVGGGLVVCAIIIYVMVFNPKKKK